MRWCTTTANSQSLPLWISMTTEAGIYRRPVISKIKMEKEIIQQGSRLGETSNQPSWKSKANRTGWLTNSGLVGARTACGWGCVAASEVPSEPCSGHSEAGRDRGAKWCRRSQVGEQEEGTREEERRGFRKGVKWIALNVTPRSSECRVWGWARWLQRVWEGGSCREEREKTQNLMPGLQEPWQ